MLPLRAVLGLWLATSAAVPGITRRALPSASTVTYCVLAGCDAVPYSAAESGEPYRNYPSVAPPPLKASRTVSEIGCGEAEPDITLSLRGELDAGRV
jgi:hypothetical protein